jgi:hypothetical protein
MLGILVGAASSGVFIWRRGRRSHPLVRPKRDAFRDFNWMDLRVARDSSPASRRDDPDFVLEMPGIRLEQAAFEPAPKFMISMPMHLQNSVLMSLFSSTRIGADVIAHCQRNYLHEKKVHAISRGENIRKSDAAKT